MKKIMTIVLSVGLFTALTGCKKKKLTKFEYDGKGYMQREYFHWLEDGDDSGSREDIVYNENGLILYKLSYYQSDVDKYDDLETKDVYEYNTNNQLIRITYYEVNDKGNELIPTAKEEYKYTSNNLTTIEYYHYTDVEFVLMRKNERVYDSKNNLISDTEYNRSTGNMLFDYKEEYTYSNNQLIKEEHFEPDSNGKDGLFKLISYKYTYDKNGNKIVEEYEDYKDTILKHKIEYEYNSNNKVTKINHYNGKENGSANYTLVFKEELTYNANNDLTLHKKEDLGSNGEFYLYYKEERTYDSSNKLIKKQEHRINGNVFVYDYEYIYYK